MHTSLCRQCLRAHSNYKRSFRGLICSDLSLLKGTFQSWWEFNLKTHLRLHANNVSSTEDFAITSCIHPSFAGFTTDLTLSPGWVHSPFLFFSTYSSHTSPALYLFLVISSYVPSFSSFLDPSTPSSFSSCPIITPLSALIFLRLPNSPAQQCYSAAY